MQLQQLKQPGPSLNEYTDIIINEVDRLSRLVDQMIGSNRPIEFSEVNIHEVLEWIKNLLSSQATGHVVIERDYDPSIPLVEGNKEQLIQALLNIGLNALQALSDAKTPAPCIIIKTRTDRQITIGSHRHRMVCRIDISDNGPRIANNLRDTIFYPMVSSKAQGTGLGLSIAQHIINQHGGLIEQRSTPGDTCFTIFIPLRLSSNNVTQQA